MKSTLFVSVFVCCLLPVLGAHAQGKGSSGDRYFYPVPQSESPYWIYSTPPCKKMPAKQYEQLKKGGKCQAHEAAKGAQACESGESVELTNASTNEKGTFPISWFVFSSKKACDADRRAYLNSES